MKRKTAGREYTPQVQLGQRLFIKKLFIMQQLQLQFHLKSHKIEAAAGYLQIVNWQFCKIAELDNVLKYLHTSFCTFR